MIFAWQGWRISLPDDWNPLKLEGTFDAGYVLIADLERPRLGLRWTTPDVATDPATLAMKALKDEVGALAAAEAISFQADRWDGAMIFAEPKPPGRDVWIGRSSLSGRMMELVHHVEVGDVSRLQNLLSGLGDSDAGDDLAWSVFDLSCKIAKSFRLESKTLNAGDLTLRFSNDREISAVRQIAVAHLALKKLPLDQWLAQAIKRHNRDHRLRGPVEKVVVKESCVKGVTCELERRGGFWRRRLAPSICILALEDVNRDKLLLVEAGDRQAAKALALTVGWADQCGQ